MNQRFRDDVGVQATDEELNAALKQLTGRLQEVMVLYYALDGNPERTTKEVASLILTRDSNKPISSGYILQIRDRGLRSIRYQLEYNRCEKHESGIPINIEYWNVSLRCKWTLDSFGAKTIHDVLTNDFKKRLGNKSKNEIVDYLAKYNLCLR